MKQKPVYLYLTRSTVCRLIEDRWEFKPVKHKSCKPLMFNWLRKINALSMTVTQDANYAHKLWVDQPLIEDQINLLLRQRNRLGFDNKDAVIYIGYDQFPELAASRHLFLQISWTEYRGIPVVIDPTIEGVLVVSALRR